MPEDKLEIALIAIKDALGLYVPKNVDPVRAIVLDIQRLNAVSDRWTAACKLASTHCPVDTGESHIRDGIPRLAKRAISLQEENEELQQQLALEQIRNHNLRERLARLEPGISRE